ncbi:hypothetical protein QQZ08_005722 [Neonectria magnoliae]|uniref:monoamine oxidase n=1 Tax=Neonectria magnoliae TaxID=2732573 RepID=A0ABR1I3H1_9HYPO
MVATSGQIGVDLCGQIAPSYKDQVKLSFLNLAAAVISGGARLEDVMKVTTYVVDYHPSKTTLIEEVAAATFGARVPGNTMIGVAKLFKPEVLFEVEATAIIADELTLLLPPAPSNPVDVIIVGAGMSGVQDAYECHKSGLSYVLLEVNDRIGGRARSEVASDTGSGLVDVGAAWINDTSQTEMYKLSKDLSLDLIAPHLERVFAALAEADPTDEKVAADLDSITFSQYVNRISDDEVIRSMGKIISRGLMGIEADVASALWLVNYIQRGTGIENLISDLEHGGQHLRIRQVISSFPRRLAERLRPGSVHLSTQVTAITQSSSGICSVSTLSGHTFTGNKVILSAPTPSYHKIQFDPPLSPSKLLMSNSTLTSYYSKLILIFSTPWWRENNLSGIMNSTVGSISFTRDSCSVEDEQYSLTAFFVGNIGHKWSLKSK